MLAIDLYKLTRVKNIDIFCLFEQKLSNRENLLIIDNYEIDSLISLVNNFLKIGIDLDSLKDFYTFYTIPQISKEFDLLRINESQIINVELKSKKVCLDKIVKQLIQNKHYLSHLSREVVSYTFICETNQIYTINEHNELIISNIRDLVQNIQGQKNCFKGNLDSLFKSTSFLVSPLNTPMKFLKKEYFLTSQQEEYQIKIINKINVPQKDSLFYGLTGAAGTGKTLLLYNLAYECAQISKTCVIHCGILSNGHLTISNNVDNLDIISAKYTTEYDYSECKYLFVDESQRFYEKQLDYLMLQATQYKIPIVFSYDAFQTLSKSEQRANVVEKLEKIPKFVEYELSDRIRTNKQIVNFMRRLINTNIPNKKYDYSCISIIYANNKMEADHFLREYKKGGYFFINFTASQYRNNNYDNYVGDSNTHKVIGQEFDKVLVLLDETFYYTGGILHAKEHPNPDYIYTQLLFQALTRVREKLAVIIVSNVPLFQEVLQILEN